MSKAPPKSMEELVERLLAYLKREHYGYDGGEKKFYQQRDTLIRAIAYPASYLRDTYQTSVSMGQYTDMMSKICWAIKRYGNTASIRYFSAYFLDCVQQHMKHHGHEYYEQAKTVRNLVENMVAGVLEKNARLTAAADSAESEMARLASAYDSLKVKGSGRKKKAPAPAPRAPRAEGGAA